MHLFVAFLSVAPAIVVAQNASSAIAAAALSSSTPSPAPPPLPQACLDALTQQQNPLIWQACGTSAWLQDFLLDHNDIFYNETALKQSGGFIGAFSFLAGFDMACAFGQTCSSFPPWPPRESSIDAVQTAIVLWSLAYVNNWYDAAFTQLGVLQHFVQANLPVIVNQLNPRSLESGRKGTDWSKIFGLISAVTSLIPNPYVKVVSGATKFIGNLQEPPPENVTAKIQPIYDLLDLQATLSAKGGYMYNLGLQSLSTQHYNIFASGIMPNETNGVLDVLGNGEWFDYIQNQNFNSPSTLAAVNQLSYDWLVSQALQKAGVFLHAVVSPDCNGNGNFGMPGERCINFEGNMYDVWPSASTWDSTEAGTAASMMQYGPGEVLYSEMLPDQSVSVTPEDLFSHSLKCQVAQSNTSPACDESVCTD